ncbi:sigma 54-interacting transcriptional regulator [Bacillus tianshenii]|nr:sigma 54-interacting transcriptional regulator [Bacillus tianshenii]
MTYIEHAHLSQCPTLLCNYKERILYTNEQCKELLPVNENLSIDQLPNNKTEIQSRTPLYSSRHNRIIGYFVELNVKARPLSPTPISTFHFKGVIGSTPSFLHTLKHTEKVAKTEIEVHLHGETGTGKEILARAIHENSPRRNEPFIAVNCGAIKDNLLQSELFGYAPGAFTGAKRNGHMGKLEQANYGTIFLDEIGEIPHDMQVALLRVLQEKEVIPVGATNGVPLNIRLITATHKNLQTLVNEGIIREDFFYRIYGFPIQIPALRDRQADISDFINYYCSKHGWKVHFPPKLLAQFKDYHWPGNVRELFTVLNRLRVLYENDLLVNLDLQSVLFTPANSMSASEQQQSIQLNYREQREKEKIISALHHQDGNITNTAQSLNISRSTLYRKMKKYKL